jgi:uncharacterized protein (TIGR03435 family)
MLITIAYHVEDFQISGEPGWVNSEHYDIEAKVDGTRTMQEINGPMLQALLADRFKLKLHGESKESPVFFLTVAKSGSKLKAGACLTRDSGTPVPAGQRQSAYCGYMGIGDNTLRATGIPIEALTGALSNILKRKVLDKTGMTGNFDVGLRWSENSADGVPSIFTALEEQLGLKLESGKAPLDILLIDHIEKPSEN